MAWNQPSKKTVAPECSSNILLVKPNHGGDLLVQRMCRNTFDPCGVEHQGDFDKERVDHLITCVKDSMPCLGLQHSWRDGPNIETNPSDIFAVRSHVLFSHGSLNSTIKKVADPTSIVC